jgi:hypothetical protein
MTRDELVDRIGGNPPPDSDKPNVDKGARIRRQEGDDLKIVETWLWATGSSGCSCLSCSLVWSFATGWVGLSMTHLSRALLILAAVLGFAYVQKLVALALVDRRLMASGGTQSGSAAAEAQAVHVVPGLAGVAVGLPVPHRGAGGLKALGLDRRVQPRIQR